MRVCMMCVCVYEILRGDRVIDSTVSAIVRFVVCGGNAVGRTAARNYTRVRGCQCCAEAVALTVPIRSCTRAVACAIAGALPRTVLFANIARRLSLRACVCVLAFPDILYSATIPAAGRNV